MGGKAVEDARAKTVVADTAHPMGVNTHGGQSPGHVGLGAGYSPPQLALIVMAIASGSVIASHVNDGGFWIISKYFNRYVKDTLKMWTVLETVLSVVGFGMAALMWQFVEHFLGPRPRLLPPSYLKVPPMAGDRTFGGLLLLFGRCLGQIRP